MTKIWCEKLSSLHKSVLFNELVDSITVYENKQNIIVDCTLWMWWHARWILNKMNFWDLFIWIDADIRNLSIVKPVLEEEYKDKWIKFIFINDNFGNLKDILEKNNIKEITGIYYDFWLSSLHIDEFDRWFSFRFDSPLDMRFDTSINFKATDVINSYSEKDLWDIFYKYAEEPKSKIIAKEIIALRKKWNKFYTTKQFWDFLDTITKFPKTKPRIFQAIRIEVNKELKMIENSLDDSLSFLQKDGIIFAISFHSLEDRIVKDFFKKESKDCICNDLICTCKHKKSLEILTKKPIIPSDIEVKQNPRSRSAKARFAKKI